MRGHVNTQPIAVYQLHPWVNHKFIGIEALIEYRGVIPQTHHSLFLIDRFLMLIYFKRHSIANKQDIERFTDL
jgi:hypothetical protein